MRHRATTRHLVMPAVTGGILMAAYLLLRPYGDHGGSTTPAAAEAYASTWWVVAHLCGALALAQFARLALRVDDLARAPLSAIGRWSGLAGLVLVLPYYGAETFGLHEVGARGLSDPGVMSLVDDIRDQPAAIATFALGLALLAVSGICTAVAFGRLVPRRWWAGWPLGLAVALVLPQFFLPPAGRMAFGVVYLACALLLAMAAWTSAHGGVGDGAGATQEEDAREGLEAQARVAHQG